MEEHSLPGSPPVPITLRRSARARRITLRVSRIDGRVTLTLPLRAPKADALDFARSREDWIRRSLARRPGIVQVAIGVEIPVEGVMHRIVPGTGRGVVPGPGQIAVPEAAAPARLQAWLRERARERLTAAADHYAAALGRPYARITLRDTRSRWGSCSWQGALMFSWRLVFAPPEVLRYVAAHEVAHLAHMDHSRAFWDAVERIHGPWAQMRDWLRVNGYELHRYRFEAPS